MRLAGRFGTNDNSIGFVAAVFLVWRDAFLGSRRTPALILRGFFALRLTGFARERVGLSLKSLIGPVIGYYGISCLSLN